MYLSYNLFSFSGVKLETTREKGDEVIKFMQERNMLVFLIPIQCIQNSVLKLIGIHEEPKRNSAEEEKILATNSNAKSTHYIQKMYNSFMFRLYDETKACAEKFLACENRSTWVNLVFGQSFRAFYIGLASYWVARSSSDRKQWYEIGNKSKSALRKWAETCRWNFEHKWYLLEAEEAFCDGKYDDAKAYYEKAVTSAKDHKVR